MSDHEPPWKDLLRKVVKSRALGRLISDEEVSALLQSAVASFGEVTDDHGGWWSAGAWRNGFAAYPEFQERVGLLAERLPPAPDGWPDWCYITRADVFAKVGTDPMDLSWLRWPGDSGRAATAGGEPSTFSPKLDPAP